MANDSKLPTLSTSDVFSEQFEQFRQTEFFRQLDRKFAPLPYYLKYKPLRFISLAASYLLHGFSALTASTLIFFFLAQLSGNKVFAALVTVALLTLLELTKRKTTTLLSKDFLQFRRVSLLLAAAVLTFSAVSITCSYFGSKQLVKEWSSPPPLANTDSLAAPIRAQLAALDRQLTQADKIRWQGRLTTKAQSIVDNLNRQKLTLQTELARVSARINHQNDQALTDHRQDVHLKSEYFGFVTFALEVLLFVCLWYLEFYDFRSFVEFVKKGKVAISPNDNFAYTSDDRRLQRRETAAPTPVAAGQDDQSAAPDAALNGTGNHSSDTSKDAIHKAIKHVKGRIASANYRIRNRIGRPETSRDNVAFHSAELKELEAML